MDTAEQARRWANAKEKLQAAQLCSDQRLYGESTTRSYYACYQAIWAVVGDPPLGLWRHGGLLNEFCRERWIDPPLPPSPLSGLRKKLEALYRLRIAADYMANALSQAEAAFGLDGAQELFELIVHRTGWT